MSHFHDGFLDELQKLGGFERLKKIFKVKGPVEKATAKTKAATERGEKTLKELGVSADPKRSENIEAMLAEMKKRASENFIEMGSYSASPNPTDMGSPLLHEQSTPYDVELKNNRQDYFMGKVMPPAGDGKIVSGRLGKALDHTKDKVDG